MPPPPADAHGGVVVSAGEKAAAAADTALELLGATPPQITTAAVHAHLAVFHQLRELTTVLARRR